MVMLIIGLLLVALSGTVLTIALKGLWNAQRSLQAHGINEPIPLNNGSRLIILGWFVGLIVGVALVAASF